MEGIRFPLETKVEVEHGGVQKGITTPPPLPTVPRFSVKKSVSGSVTEKEIAKFWRRKRLEEEDHLLAAIKAAARIKARKFSEQDYKMFVDLLQDERKDKGEKKSNEQHIGIKDWWTRSKYAYLNQPAIDSDPPENRTSSYTPYCMAYKPSPLYPTSVGVF